MAIPTKSQFQEVAELKLYWDSLAFERKEPEIEDLNLDSCEVFANRVFDQNELMLDRMRSLQAWKWLQSDPSWKIALKELFKTESPKRISRNEFVKILCEYLLKKAEPISQQKYNWLVDLKKQSRARQEKSMRSLAYSETEIQHFLDQDSWYSIESFSEVNSYNSRLKTLNDAANDYLLHSSQSADMELLILDVIGRYFYDQDFLKDYLANEPEQDYIDEALEWDSGIERGCNAIDDLLPLLSEQLELSRDFNSKVDIDKYKKLITWLNDFKETLEFQHGRLFEDLEDDYKRPPIIKRRGGADRERAFAYELWKIIREYTTSRPTQAILNLLNLEGVHDIPHERNIEKWIQSWDKSWRKEQEELWGQQER